MYSICKQICGGGKSESFDLTEFNTICIGAVHYDNWSLVEQQQHPEGIQDEIYQLVSLIF